MDLLDRKFNFLVSVELNCYKNWEESVCGRRLCDFCPNPQNFLPQTLSSLKVSESTNKNIYYFILEWVGRIVLSF